MDVRGWSPATVFGLFLSAACSGEPASGADADAAADGDDDGGGLEIAPPAAPVLTPCPEGWEEVTDPESGLVTCDPWPDGGPAVLTPCPSGWREVADPETGTATCDPWPEGGAEDCTAVDEAHFSGEPGCTRIGTACTEDPWASDLPADREILYVLAGGPAGGAGTRAVPFGTIAEATAATSEGAILALSKGTFDEAVVVPAGVTLWGACVAQTVVASSRLSEMGATITCGGGAAAVRNLRVQGERRGVSVASSRSVDLRDLVIAGVLDTAILATGRAHLTAVGLVVRDTRSAPSSRGRGFALEASLGAQVEITRAVFERNREVGVAVFDAGTSVTLEDVVVRDTLERECAGDPRPCGGAGMGLGTYAGANLVARRFLVTRSALCGVQLAHGADAFGVRYPEGGTMDLHDGEVSYNTVCGANVQTAGFDLDRLMDNVLFRGNGQNLDTSDLPVPDPGTPLPEP